MSHLENEHMEDLIGKFILGEASPEEVEKVEKWCGLHPENQKYLEDSRLIFEKSQRSSKPHFDADKAWDSVLNHINSQPRSQWSRFSLWKIAASLLLLAAISFVFYSLFSPGEEMIFRAENEVSTQVFPDLTEISLNRNSLAKVFYNPRKKTATVQLEGEATLDIGEDEEIRWDVRVGDLLIRDIGTFFHVKAYPLDDLVEVSVLEGVVEMIKPSGEKLTLRDGEMGVYDKNSGTFATSPADRNVVAFKTKKFQFEEQSLGNVIQSISNVYGRKIRLSGPLEECKITVGFENEDLKTILEILSETMGLRILETQEEIVLQGEGCF